MSDAYTLSEDEDEDDDDVVTGNHVYVPSLFNIGSLL